MECCRCMTVVQPQCQPATVISMQSRFYDKHHFTPIDKKTITFKNLFKWLNKWNDEFYREIWSCFIGWMHLISSDESQFTWIISKGPILQSNNVPTNFQLHKSTKYLDGNKVGTKQQRYTMQNGCVLMISMMNQTKAFWTDQKRKQNHRQHERRTYKYH